MASLKKMKLRVGDILISKDEFFYKEGTVFLVTETDCPRFLSDGVTSRVLCLLDLTYYRRCDSIWRDTIVYRNGKLLVHPSNKK